MSYFTAPETNKKYEIFGASKGESLAQSAQAPLLGQIPSTPNSPASAITAISNTTPANPSPSSAKLSQPL